MSYSPAELRAIREAHGVEEELTDEEAMQAIAERVLGEGCKIEVHSKKSTFFKVVGG